jgi:hypothetical protein
MQMPRYRQRVCLQDGLKLDINKLARQGLFQPGVKVGPVTIGWTDGSGEIADTASITAFAQTEKGGWFRIQMNDLDQCLDLVAQPRHFGGRQLYLKSPITYLCAVLWMPRGAKRFCGRHEWDGRVAYASQFDTPIDRAYRGKARIKSRLIGDLDPDEWVLRTYEALERKFDTYENLLHQSARSALARVVRRMSLR